MPGMYRLQNYNDCVCGPMHGAAKAALTQPITQFRDGYGHAGQGGCVIQTDSKLRLGGAITNDRGPQTLHERMHLSVPYMGRGIGDPCAESGLKEGIDTSSKRQCNTLAGVHVPHQYTPLVPCLRDEIQNPAHLVPETNRTDWIRGGYPSRQWVHNMRYCRQCNGESNLCRCYHKGKEGLPGETHFADDPLVSN